MKFIKFIKDNFYDQIIIKKFYFGEKIVIEILLSDDMRQMDAYILENIKFPNIVSTLIFTKNEMIKYNSKVN